MPVIYTSAPFWNGSAADSTAFAKNPLWVANWGVTCPNIPSAWNTWSLWQFADNGNVPGIAFSVDLDKSNGTTLPTYADTTPPVLTLPSTITTVNSFHLAGGIQNSFDSQLQAVQADLTANNTANACSDLTGFINHAKAQSGKHLTESQANQLIAAATQIQAVLGC